MRFQVRYTRIPMGMKIRSNSGCSIVNTFLSLHWPVTFSAYTFGDFSSLFLELCVLLLRLLLQSCVETGRARGTVPTVCVGCGWARGTVSAVSVCLTLLGARCGSR